LERFAAAGGRVPVVLVTHHLEEVTPAFTHALLLKEGRVLAAGRADGVLTEANLAALFGAKVRLAREGARRRMTLISWGA
jgi:iron complex transport system ATP-binding protein